MEMQGTGDTRTRTRARACVQGGGRDEGRGAWCGEIARLLKMYRLSPPALWFDLFKPRGGLETAFHKL